ncbi:MULTISPECIES: S8 family serine peptidase [unclassified Streptomyces]|uniref:S8 family peptidase n=1 Tax=unclassified Streptomyces TaxID=2593676 RepID=UPI002DD8BA91|nr:MULTISPECIES: S8 family serine peptidase [unclassified Streptomyces]WSA95684.1 S8 family serine peptidase [Streptomyces sp. NBC_01795]WSB80103.1 S8 family serine peptidase [Streptomyces sp. NBC_01775]WSS11689.1 S8 family serine peptidase [Streptomyces sp. NBC_01186]WSS40402.1 S8 family serine peptidase [Streptomyces sp. NBC_01187]
MDSRPSRRRRILALPLGLVLTASLGLAGAAAANAQNAGDDDAPKAKAGEKLSYVVNTETDPGTVERVKKEIRKADGKVVTAYKKIGVIVAHSTNPEFGQTLRAVDGVDSAGATRTAPLKAATTTEVGKPVFVKAPKAAALAQAKAKGQEPLESLQWDKRAIKADKAAKVDEGSKKVTVGVIDTGVDDTHPDLKPNFSAKQSANCVGGKPDASPGAWRPYDPANDYHGTHVAGIIAAPRNGVGVAGAAPGVKVAALKVSEPDTSLFYSEAVVCAMVYAADHGVQVTNNSYYVDPWLYNCGDQADQKAIADSVGRAIKYAQGKGVTTVSSAGNSSHDLASTSIVDDTSPDDGTPVKRTVNPAVCPDVPTMLPGTTSVGSTGPENLKSYYSNYGLNQIDVTAPGGDRRYQTPEEPAKDGGVLSTMPDGDYAYLQGTSMAGPQVAGVAALIKSTHPKATPQEVAWRLKGQAQTLPCPDNYDPDGQGTYAAKCTGVKGNNSFNGHGLVDALAAVTK